MEVLTKVCGVIDGVSRFFFQLCAGLAFVLVLLTVEQVGARYLYGGTSIALQELQWHMFGFIFLCGGAYTLKLDGHVRVDTFSSKFSHTFKKNRDRFGFLCFLLPSQLVLVIYGAEFVELARSFGPEAQGVWEFLLKGEGSADPGGLPARWLVKSLIPLGAGLMIWQGLGVFLASFLEEKGP